MQLGNDFLSSLKYTMKYLLSIFARKKTYIKKRFQLTHVLGFNLQHTIALAN